MYVEFQKTYSFNPARNAAHKIEDILVDPEYVLLTPV
jgi:hypothetical protein